MQNRSRNRVHGSSGVRLLWHNDQHQPWQQWSLIDMVGIEFQNIPMICCSTMDNQNRPLIVLSNVEDPIFLN